MQTTLFPLLSLLPVIPDAVFLKLTVACQRFSFPLPVFATSSYLGSVTTTQKRSSIIRCGEILL